MHALTTALLLLAAWGRTTRISPRPPVAEVGRIATRGPIEEGPCRILGRIRAAGETATLAPEAGFALSF
jgi:hypothetical protein